MTRPQSHAHSSGRIVSLDDTRWICKCGEIFADDAAWRAHRDAAVKPTIDPPGTCHKVSCPGKGQHPPHGIEIGAGTWDDYIRVDHCLGYPKVKAGNCLIHIVCSLDGTWNVAPRMTVTPAELAELVDLHRAECTNRSPR